MFTSHSFPSVPISPFDIRCWALINYSFHLELANFFSVVVSKLQNSKQLEPFCTEIGNRNPDKRFVGFHPLLTMCLTRADVNTRDELMKVHPKSNSPIVC